MEDFIKVFVVGMLLFVAAIALLGSGPIDSGTKTGDFNKEHILYEGSIGAVGVVTENSRNIPIADFEVGYTIGDKTLVNEEEITIENGWFRQNFKELTFSGEEVQKMVLLFDVFDMNTYGNLTVKLNGNILHTNITYPGEYRFESEDLKETNTITIESISSRLKFWAPTTYILNNLKIVVESYGVQEKIIPFEIYNYESAGWSRGTFSFYVEDSIKNNPLYVELNNYKIYEEKPLSSEIIYEQKFTQLETKLKTGENILKVSSGKDSKYSLKNAELTIFFYSSGQAVSKSKTFDVDRYIIYLMESSVNVTGRINVTVNEAPVDTGLTMNLNDKIYHVDSVGSNETISLPFVLDDIHEGKNTLSFSTHGTYKLG
ncbi:hypothetical protein GQ473_01415, partial [archaeon]|nr:hypothetical protein [archaeon]